MKQKGNLQQKGMGQVPYVFTMTDWGGKNHSAKPAMTCWVKTYHYHLVGG